MKILVATVRTPGIQGGAEDLAEGLVEAIRQSGHKVDLLALPFRYQPVGEIHTAMDAWTDYRIDTAECDRVIYLKFPAYYCKHPKKVTWLLHQHRPSYDLWDSNLGEHDETDIALRSRILEEDNRALQECHARFTISKTVSDRLRAFNGFESQHLYPPTKLEGLLYCAPAEPFIFYPSRIEGHKRQKLLVEAMTMVKSRAFAFIAGEGGQKEELERMVEDLDLSERVLLLGHVPEEELIALYAHSLAVFFGPYQEDYGFVTIEAMLSSKPVITCIDSGGPTEFVVDGVTGRVVGASAESVAAAIDELFQNKRRARHLGQVGFEHIVNADITWKRVVDGVLSG